MASHTRPFLTSGAALASAAAIVLATPAVAPGIAASSLSTSLSTSAAQYELATFADLFTIPAGEWINAYFQGYGGIVGPNNPFPLEPYATNCDGQCVLVGVSSLAYLALDAVINGNGEGWEDAENWNVSAINYLFEADWSLDPGGISAGVLYLLQTSIGSANPLLSTAITLAFAGPALVTIVFDNAMQLLGDAALGLPLAGPYLYGAINAFLGPASLNEDYQGYFPGVTGVLNWGLDLLAGTAPTPPAPEAEGAAAVAAAAVTTAAPAAETPDAVESPAAVEAAPVEAAVEATVADDAPAVEADAVEGGAVEAEAETETAPVTAADVKADTVEAATEAAETAADSPAKADAKRPVRDAVAAVTAAVGSALGGSASADAEDTGSADSGSADSGSADSEG